MPLSINTYSKHWFTNRDTTHFDLTIHRLALPSLHSDDIQDDAEILFYKWLSRETFPAIVPQRIDITRRGLYVRVHVASEWASKRAERTASS